MMAGTKECCSTWFYVPALCLPADVSTHLTLASCLLEAGGSIVRIGVDAWHQGACFRSLAA